LATERSVASAAEERLMPAQAADVFLHALRTAYAD
jgi:hypothetical protein